MRRRLAEPQQEVAKNVALRKVGVRLRIVLERVVREMPQVMSVGEALGSGSAFDFDDDTLMMCRQMLAKEFGLATPPPKNGYWADLFQWIIEEANDPDTDIPDWIRDGFPLGIDRPITPRGVFPATTADSASIELSRAFGKIKAWAGLSEHRNYKSFYEEATAADADFKDRIVSKGFAERIRDTKELERRFGEVRAPKVAVVAKTKNDGTKKVRLIVDMLRSGTNGDIMARERLVLPRMTDLAESTVDLIELQRGEAKTRNCEMFAFDFADAFYTLHIAESERRHVIARGSHDWFVYRCVAFGLASGPLLWGRLAASASRFAQAIFAPEELRLQTYVDDPAGAVAGETVQERTRLLVILVLFLRALGFQLSWKKVQRGKAVDWIGARFRLAGSDEVVVELSTDKVDALQELCCLRLG